MFACVDVGYAADRARAACVLFHCWEAGTACGEHVVDVSAVAPYVPGEFYRRELPCLLAVLTDLSVPADVVVIDGYVWLDQQAQAPGLGAYLFAELGGEVPVIGVAKSRFARATGATELFRGSSVRPLLISAVGCQQRQAVEWIGRMDGTHRMPTLLRRVDQLSRIG